VTVRPNVRVGAFAPSVGGVLVGSDLSFAAEVKNIAPRARCRRTRWNKRLEKARSEAGKPGKIAAPFGDARHGRKKNFLTQRRRHAPQRAQA